ncbi:MAG: glycerophosphoryl diester phosphodiesterase membrane domain-containing protein [Sphingomonadales bacterium]|nr:glycerophosphoryl diester phosphodiesterase membrane domain-containing protein [Sphingomonadales bacterium]
MNAPAPLARFDSNRAWQETSAAISAGRDVIAALAGVFIVLPAFALAVLRPMPEPRDGADFDALMAGITTYFEENWWAYLVVGLINVVGTMALLAMFGHSSRPTAGEAIKRGFAAAPAGIAAQILLGMALSAAVMLPGTILALSGSPLLAGLGIAIGVGAATWLWARLSIAAPIIVNDGQNNPFTALQRSFVLTRGNAGRLLLFYVLLVLAFAIATQLIVSVVTLAAQAAGGPHVALIVGALVASVLQAAMTVYLAGAVAASHRQLTGTTHPTVPGVFG